MVDQVFPLRRAWSWGVVAIVCTLVTVLLGQVAYGLPALGGIDVDGHGIWSFAVCAVALLCLLLAVLAFWVFLQSGRTLTLVLSDVALVAPAGMLSRRYASIPYLSMQALRRQKWGPWRALCVVHDTGSLTLWQSQLGGARAFNQVCSVLLSRLDY